MKFKTIEVKGRQFEVEITERGKFSVTIDGHQTVADTLIDLETRLAKNTTFRATCKVPFVSRDGRRGIFTGIHAANGNFLVKWDSGGNEQMGDYSVDRNAQMSDAEFAEYSRLRGEQEKAEGAVEAFFDSHRPLAARSLGRQVRDALNSSTPDVPSAVKA